MEVILGTAAMYEKAITHKSTNLKSHISSLTILDSHVGAEEVSLCLLNRSWIVCCEATVCVQCSVGGNQRERAC